MCATAERAVPSRSRRIGAVCLVLALCGLAGLVPSPFTGGRPGLDTALPDAGGNGFPEERTEAWDIADESEIPVVATLSGPSPAPRLLPFADLAPMAGTARRPIRPPT